MSDNDRVMTFRAEQPATFAALQEAARRSGLRQLSSDPAKGLTVFTAGMSLMSFGEKVTARIQEAGPGVVTVTLSSDLRFGMVGWRPNGTRRDRMSDALVGLLPSAQ